MKKRNLILIIIVIIVVIVVAYFLYFLFRPESITEEPEVQAPAPEQGLTPETPVPETLEELTPPETEVTTEPLTE